MSTRPRMPRAKFCLWCSICKSAKIEDTCTYDVNCVIPMVFIHAKISLARKASNWVRHLGKREGKRKGGDRKAKGGKGWDATLMGELQEWSEQSRHTSLFGGNRTNNFITFHVGASFSVCNHYTEGGTWCISFLLLPLSLQRPHMPAP